MSPRNLRLLSIEDHVVRRIDDVVSAAPVDVLDEAVSRWLDFCRLLATRALPDFELITIDLNFNEDDTSPRFPPMDGSWEVDPDYGDDPLLRRLGWSRRLQGTGKNSGLVIGATAVGAALFRGVPVGAAVYTGFPDMPTRDVTSALLLAQILLVSDTGRHADDALSVAGGRELLRGVVRYVNACARTQKDALPSAVRRFRDSLLRRAGVDGSGPSLWIDAEALVTLQAALSATTQAQLDERLDQHGLRFYDRDGRVDCLGLHSLFADRLAEYDDDKLVRSFRNRLLLDDVRETSDTGRLIHSFLDQLRERAAANVRPVIAFLNVEGPPTETVNRILPHPTHRLLALLFAYCNQYASRYQETGQSWNLLEWRADPAGDGKSLRTHMATLLRLLNAAQADADAPDTRRGVALVSAGSESIAKMIHDSCADNQYPPFARALGYLEDDADEPAPRLQSGLSDARLMAISRMLQVLSDNDCVKKVDDKYVVVRRELPERLTLPLDRQDLARRLGFERGNAANNLGEIISRALHCDPRDFLIDLVTRPLPAHLHRLCGDYMRRYWPELGEKNWPPCLSPRQSEIAIREPSASGMPAPPARSAAS